jgi:putative peptidoglycan lipid II flippase
VGFMLVKVLAPGFYARQDTRTPVRVGVISVGVNIVLSLALVGLLRHNGLALAISLAAFVNAALLYRGLRRERIYSPEPGWRSYLLKLGCGSALMGVVLWWGVGSIDDWLAAGLWARILRLGFWVIIGAVIYFAALLAFGLRPQSLLLKKPQAI